MKTKRCEKTHHGFGTSRRQLSQRVVFGDVSTLTHVKSAPGSSQGSTLHKLFEPIARDSDECQIPRTKNTLLGKGAYLFGQFRSHALIIPCYRTWCQWE